MKCCFCLMIYDERGLSSIVTIAFIILGTVIGVALLWAFVMKSTSRSGEIVDFSPEKISYGGRKQVFRQFDGNIFIEDIIGLENEDLPGEPLLEPVIIKGNLVKNLPSLNEIRKYTAGQYTKFDKKLFDITQSLHYPVEISKGIVNIMNSIKR